MVPITRIPQPGKYRWVDKKVRQKMARKLWWFTFIMLSLGNFLIMARGAMMAL
jgi:hypothetical protein